MDRPQPIPFAPNVSIDEPLFRDVGAAHTLFPNPAAEGPPYATLARVQRARVAQFRILPPADAEEENNGHL